MATDTAHTPLNVQIDVSVIAHDAMAVRSFVAKQYGKFGSHTPHLVESVHPRLYVKIR